MLFFALAFLLLGSIQQPRNSPDERQFFLLRESKFLHFFGMIVSASRRKESSYSTYVIKRVGNESKLCNGF